MLIKLVLFWMVWKKSSFDEEEKYDQAQEGFKKSPKIFF